MDILTIPGSRITEIGRLAFARPDVDFLCFGESDRSSPASVHAAATFALEAGHTRYPDVRGLPELRHALAEYLTRLHAQSVTEDMIQVTASGMAAVAVAFSGILRPGERVVMHGPAWPNIANAARVRGSEPEVLPLTALPEGGFRLDPGRLADMLPGARALLLNSPNNPTGWTATHEELSQILALCRKHGVWLISDEVYSRLFYGPEEVAPSVLDVAQPDDRVIVCNSFSKTWIMTGWRLGWMVVPHGTRDAFAELVEVAHSGVAPFIQHAGLAAVSDEATPCNFRRFCARGRELLGEALSGLNGIRYTAPHGAFYGFVRIEGLTDSVALARRLVLEHGVAVAPGVAFGASGEGHLRICFAQSEAKLQRAMDRLRSGLRGPSAEALRQAGEVKTGF
jgi:aspartate aminotransferase